MDDKTRTEIEESLREASLMDEDDSLLNLFRGDYYETFLVLRLQTRGYYYITKKSIIFIGGLASSVIKVIPYQNIKFMKKYRLFFMLPFGIKIVSYDEKKGKDVTHRLSVNRRNDWYNFIEGKRNNG